MGESTHDRWRERSWSASRRDFLRATVVAGGLTAGFGSVAVDSAAASIPTPWLHVDGNLVRDPAGRRVTLRGINIADPKRVNVTAPARGKTAEQVVDVVTDESRGWYTRMIRLAVQPVDIGEHQPGQGPPPVAFTESQLERYLTNHLDSVVEHCKQRGVYCIIDYHRHRDIQWTNSALDEEIRMFWNVVAPRYGDQSHVLYEMYNEPQTPGMWGDPTTTEWIADTWRDWKATAQPWVDIIRGHAPDNLILIGSPSWTQSPEGALVEPFDGENLAYTYHIYPGHNVSRQQAWDDASINGEGVANVYEEYPLFVTEFGWQSDIQSRWLRGTTTDFGQSFMNWLENQPAADAIHWTAWVGDPIWLPAMFDRAFTDEEADNSIGNPYEEPIPELCPDLPCEWSLLTGENMGGFIKNTLADLRNDGVPSDGDSGGSGG